MRCSLKSKAWFFFLFFFLFSWFFLLFFLSFFIFSPFLVGEEEKEVRRRKGRGLRGFLGGILGGILAEDLIYAAADN